MNWIINVLPRHNEAVLHTVDEPTKTIRLEDGRRTKVLDFYYGGSPESMADQLGKIIREAEYMTRERTLADVRAFLGIKA